MSLSPDRWGGGEGSGGLATGGGWGAILLEARPRAGREAPDLVCAGVSGAAWRLLPAQPEAIGRPFAELAPEIATPDLTAELLRLALHGGGWEAVRTRGDRGQERWYRLAARGEGGRVAIDVEDITEEWLRRSEARFRLLAESAQDMLCCVADDGRLLYMSPASRLVLGIEPSDLVGVALRDVVHPEDRERIDDLAARLARVPGGAVTVEARLRHGAGGYVPTEIACRLVADPSGRGPAGVVAVARDISTRLKAEADLRWSEERYRSVISAMAEGVTVHDRAGRVFACNAAAERLLGVPAGALIGVDFREPGWRPVREDGTDYPMDEHPAARTLRTGESRRGVLMGMHRPDGGIVWLSVSSQAILGSDASPEAAVVTFADVTEARIAEFRLRTSETRARALAAEQAALLRVVASAATGSPAEAYARVAEEAGQLVGVDHALLVRSDQGFEVLGSWSRGAFGRESGGVPAAARAVAEEVRAQGRAARVARLPLSPDAAQAGHDRAAPRDAVGAPVNAGHAPAWGMLLLTVVPGRTMPADAEVRLARFADLVAVALVGLEGRRTAPPGLAGTLQGMADAVDPARSRGSVGSP